MFTPAQIEIMTEAVTAECALHERMNTWRYNFGTTPLRRSRAVHGLIETAAVSVGIRPQDLSAEHVRPIRDLVAEIVGTFNARMRTNV